MELTLKRVLFTDDGTIGVLTCGYSYICLTLEENWRENQKHISCIPEGSYICRAVNTPKHGETFQIMHVPDRDSVLFHSGNTEADTEGCILTGKEFGYIQARDDETKTTETQLAVLRSKEAFKEFMNVVDGKETFALRIMNC